MDLGSLLLGLGIGAVLGGAGMFIRLARVRESLARITAQYSTERQAWLARDEQWQTLQQSLQTHFKAMSQDVLRSTSQDFVQLAQSTLTQYHESARMDLESKREAIAHLVTPLQDSLSKVDQKLLDIEKQRVGAYAGLTQQVQSLLETQQGLRQETASLALAMRAPQTRGRWGELQLRRVVELAGMVAYCDFVEQHSHHDQEGVLRRPDMIVRLPGQKQIVVDAKAPLSAYMDAVNTSCHDQRHALMQEHARLIRTHIQQLAHKRYWDQLDSPEFVVLFLPGENFFSAALEVAPELIEYGVDHKVVLATPTTLISVLRSVSYGWRQEELSANVMEVQKLGKELYGRMADFIRNWDDVGKHLRNAVEAYNKSVGNLENRVMVSMRRFQDLKAEDPGKDLREPKGLEVTPRISRLNVNIPELD